MKKPVIALSVLSMILAMPSNISYADNFSVRDISGNDRFSTAVSIAKKGWEKGAENVILVNGQAVADSLSIAPLASKLKAPVLLTNSNFLNEETRAEIERLQSKRVIIVGGYNSVSQQIEENLRNKGFEIERISGDTRIETSINIAKRLNDFSKDSLKEAFLVNGIKGLADAAGAGAIAAKHNAPIIFADVDKYENVKESIGNLNIEDIYLIGGNTSLPEIFENISDKVERISGSNRQETNLKLIDKFYKNYNTIYMADDGSSQGSKLIDSVLINAGIIASNNTSERVEYIPKSVSQEETGQKENLDTDLKDTDEENNSEKSLSESQERASAKEVLKDNLKTASEDVNQTPASTLPEGPVMLLSENRGFTYKQMQNIYNHRDMLESIVQVSGGNKFKKYIENISDFIINKDDSKANSAFDKMMSYEYVTITYNIAGKKTRLDGNSILQMIECNSKNNFNLTFNRQMVRKFISNLSVNNLASKKSGPYAYIKNGKVLIEKFGNSVYLNIEKETDNLLSKLYSQKSYFDIIPNYTEKAAPAGAVNLGNNYVQIDLKTQHMWVWKNGKVVVSTPIVSGNPNKGMATPPGIFAIRSKMRNVVLRGPGYASPVKYWIPFNGSIGIHDAYWQPIYGGNRYLYAGSHGCINTPLAAVSVLYQNVSIGTPVVVQTNTWANQ